MRRLIDRDSKEAIKQGHSLVVLFEEEAKAWVLWRWCHPVSFGLVCGRFGEVEAVPRETGLENFETWLVVPRNDGHTAFCAAETKLNSKAIEAELTTTADEANRKAKEHLVDECVALLAEHTGMDIPGIVRRTIHESLCIGIALVDEDAEP